MPTEISGSTGVNKVQDDSVAISDLSATGTASSSTFLRGDNTWVAAGSTSATDLTSGTLPLARLPAGTILQVVSATKLDTWTYTGSTTFQDVTGLTAAITPETNKVMIPTIPAAIIAIFIALAATAVALAIPI